MNKVKKLAALILTAAVAVSVAACHPQNEVAYTVKDAKTGQSVKITSGMYLYFATTATMQAQQKINEANSDKTITDYTKYSVTDDNGKKVKYNKWIKNELEELLRQYSGVMLKKKELKLKLDDATEANAKNYADMYWSYGYSTMFEKNGVGQETYRKASLASYYQNEYFLSIYDTDGTEPVKEKLVNSTFYDNYCLADTITIALKAEEASEETDDEAKGMDKAEAKALLKSYQKRLIKGEKFADIFAEYNKQYNSDSEQAGSDSASVYGSDKTDNNSEFFEDVNKLKTGAVKILTCADGGEMLLVQKKDISKDEEKYYKNYRNSTLYIIKEDEFNANFKKYCDGLKLENNESATNRLDLSDIDLSQSAEQ